MTTKPKAYAFVYEVDLNTSKWAYLQFHCEDQGDLGLKRGVWLELGAPERIVVTARAEDADMSTSEMQCSVFHSHKLVRRSYIPPRKWKRTRISKQYDAIHTASQYVGMIRDIQHMPVLKDRHDWQQRLKRLYQIVTREMINDERAALGLDPVLESNPEYG